MKASQELLGNPIHLFTLQLAISLMALVVYLNVGDPLPFTCTQTKAIMEVLKESSCTRILKTTHEI